MENEFFNCINNCKRVLIIVKDFTKSNEIQESKHIC